MIQIRDLSFTYPGRTEPALNDVSLDIDRGEFVLLAGRSGMGKSTLLRLINGLVPHFTGGKISGSVVVNGIDVIQAGPQALSQHVGLVFQDPEAQAIVGNVEREIAFGLEEAGLPPDEMRLRVEEVLDLLDIEPLRERTIDQLSGGERQRVAIAAVMAMRPSVLVLDEPTSQLDPKSAEDVVTILERLNQDLGITIILAEHRLERVLRAVDRLLFIDQGEILVDDEVHAGVAQLPISPPLVELGKALDWLPLPLTIKEGRRFARRITTSNEDKEEATPSKIAEDRLLLIKQLDVGFPNRPKLIVNQVSIDLHAGEVVGLMGRNGSGKSTLLRGVVNLITPRRGEIIFDGEAVTGKPTHEICREIAYLPQNPDDLLYATTVRQEIEQTLINHGRAVDEPLVTDHLARYQLLPLQSFYPRDLSVGQRLRVALASLMITGPKVLLLDEPTRGLDYEAKSILVEIWKELQQEGIGILLVSHDVELVAKVADRVVIMSQGEVVAQGKTRDILRSTPLFSPQIAKLFPNRTWMTVDEVLSAL